MLIKEAEKDTGEVPLTGDEIFVGVRVSRCLAGEGVFVWVDRTQVKTHKPNMTISYDCDESIDRTHTLTGDEGVLVGVIDLIGAGVFV